jgi:MFS family permease
MYSILILPPIYMTYSLYDYFTLEIILSLFYVGISIGSFISILLSDRYGRKPVIFISTVLLAINSYLHT